MFLPDGGGALGGGPKALVNECPEGTAPFLEGCSK